MYKKEFGVVGEEENVDDTNWTGAEIKSCCRLSTGLELSLEDASEYVISISTSNPERIKRLREWAKGRCLSASLPGIYKKEEVSTKRKVKA